MKIKVLTIALLLGGLTFSCSETKKEETKTVESHEGDNHSGHDHSQDEEHTVEEVKGLELNNGDKWEANAETHEGMGKIKTIIEASKPSSIAEFIAMGTECDGQTSYIINNCSMTGESHNQLHFVLHPILDDIDGLSTAGTVEEGEKAYESLTKNIADYFKFFKV